MNVKEKVTEMFLEINNNPRNHKTVKTHFPSECISDVCDALSVIDELYLNRNIFTELKVRMGLCTLEFRYFTEVSDEYPLEKRVRNEFYKE